MTKKAEHIRSERVKECVAYVQSKVVRLQAKGWPAEKISGQQLFFGSQIDKLRKLEDADFWFDTQDWDAISFLTERL